MMNHQDRIDATLLRMRERNLALIAAFSNGAHHVETPDAVSLLSGVRPMGDCMVVLLADGRSTLYVMPAWDAARARRRSTTTVTVGTSDLSATFAEVVSGHAPNAGAVGVTALSRMPQRFVEGVRGALGGEPVPFDDVLIGISELSLGAADPGKAAVAVSRCKTDQELESARTATAIAEAGHRKMLEIARPGMLEYELASEVKAHMTSLGADDNFLMLSARQHNRAVMPSSGRPLEPGDIIVAEATPCFEGQFSQICRSAVLGRASTVQEEKYALVVEAMHAGIRAAKPGNRMSAVCNAIDRVLSDAGYAKYCRPPHMRRRGHGLGISSIVPGNVSRESEVVLEEDMFFVVHPNQYLPETGYLLCGEPIVVRPGGGESLTRETAWLASIPV